MNRPIRENWTGNDAHATASARVERRGSWRPHLAKHGTVEFALVGLTACIVFAIALSLTVRAAVKGSADHFEQQYSSSLVNQMASTTRLAPHRSNTDFPRRIPVPVAARVHVPDGPEDGPFVALLAKEEVSLRGRPAGEVARRFPAKLYGRSPTTFLAIGESLDSGGRRWYRVLVPARPNGSQAWVVGESVTKRVLRSALAISQTRNTLELYDNGRLRASYPVCLGASATPTPGGLFFVDQLIHMSPGGAYGPLAFGLSAFSKVLTDWPGGGVVGIHGTNAPSSIGRDVSHGCIRLRNRDILTLGRSVSLGTPVFIRG